VRSQVLSEHQKLASAPARANQIAQANSALVRHPHQEKSGERSRGNCSHQDDAQAQRERTQVNRHFHSLRFSDIRFLAICLTLRASVHVSFVQTAEKRHNMQHSFANLDNAFIGTVQNSWVAPLSRSHSIPRESKVICVDIC
jgi:hypothetical protein